LTVKLSTAELRAEIVKLGPWHLDVEVTPEVSTAAYLDAPPGTYDESLGVPAFIYPGNRFKQLIADIYPRGLEGRGALDCGCNCGGWLFWAKEQGAGQCFGFDVRQHWVDQARFLADHRTKPSDGMTFEVLDLYKLPERGLVPADLTIFNGLFYHLPDPITGLKVAADLTQELIVLNTATMPGQKDTLIAHPESDTLLMSGVYQLAWFPTGEDVLRRILAWCGFPHMRVSFRPVMPDSTRSRIEVIAARREATFADFDAARLDSSP
jgi:hypothetical protein